ncbi:hypothetical protein DFS34DRAFT_578036 [Phlyctochytrium arcticum]|nr:hypothetical protein DFS34DRAFT_578036 [Phlyctochytrium arcticum]
MLSAEPECDRKGETEISPLKQRGKRSSTVSHFFGQLRDEDSQRSPKRPSIVKTSNQNYPLLPVSEQNLHSQQFSVDVPSPSSSSNVLNQKNAFDILRTSSSKPSAWRTPLPPKTLTAQTIALHLPCELFLNFLPDDLAWNLLGRMVDEAQSWRVRKFVLFDREVESPHTTSLYTNTPTLTLNQANDSAPSDEQPDMDKGSPPKVDFYYSGKKTTDVRPIFPDLARARDLVTEHINRRFEERASQLGIHRHPDEIVGRWEPNIVLGNCYKGADAGVGAHNDRMTYTGPRATIGSLTLGAERAFRVRGIPRPPSSDKEDQEDRRLQTFNIFLPHNSLLIMFPPMQERFRHSIPKCSSKLLKSHPLSKDTRINLTFRVARPEYRDHIPKCYCNIPSELRIVIKQEGTLGKYFYMCGGGGKQKEDGEVNSDVSGGASGGDGNGDLDGTAGTSSRAGNSAAPAATGDNTCGFFEWLDIDAKNREARRLAALKVSSTSTSTDL